MHTTNPDHLIPSAWYALGQATLTGKGGKTLAPATKRRAIVRLKSVMAHARKTRWLTYDPSADLESPEQKSVTATAADDIWTPAQMGKFLDHVAPHRLAGCFALTLLGLRREEVGGLRWSDLDIMCGHFPEGVQTYKKKSIDGVTRGDCYLRQMLGSANISGNRLLHFMTGNLSFQIEHHLFPDLPSNRYQEIAPKVQELFERHGLTYVSGPMVKQVGLAWKKVFRLSLPNDVLRKATAAV